MQALILAGGLGTRLRPVVSDRPKPLAPVAGTPFLARLLRWLGRQGITEVILCVGYQWENIRDAVGDGTALGVSVCYAVEDTPLGTAGALKNAESFVTGPFFVLNGDTFVDVTLRDLMVFHQHTGALGTLTLVQVLDPRPYGAVALGPFGRIFGFVEKGRVTEASSSWVNGGVYVFEPTVLEGIPRGRAVSLETEVLPALIAAGAPLYGYRSRGYFIDIGTPERYARSQRELKELL
ncbi:MAG: nucleotidyltransferase family protein [Desulfosoma sp.]|uniref:nucleotidyltransferase family protein n=1 Tax=Desulfosoma sp. TaxID=2603217 RepID=UPI004049B5AB